MKYSSITARFFELGGDKWELCDLADDLKLQNKDIIELTLGEFDSPTPPELVDIAVSSMRAGRTKYSSGKGDPNLLNALSERYTKKIGRPINTDQILCFPGAQAALFATLMVISEFGDEILVCDPFYSSYEGIITASGASIVPIRLQEENDFKILVSDIERQITSKSRAILLNTPHNPTGLILTKDTLFEIGNLARKNDLWLISDEVYEELIFPNEKFASPLEFSNFANLVIVISSISKSHAATGFRSGWCIGPNDFTKRLSPLSEIMFFGNQPFIADMTAKAISSPSKIANHLRIELANRAKLFYDLLNGVSGLRVSRPQAGMFVLLNIQKTGMSARDYAVDLLEKKGVAVMPGTSFGNSLNDWVRIALTINEEIIIEACRRIIEHTTFLSLSLPKSN